MAKKKSQQREKCHTGWFIKEMRRGGGDIFQSDNVNLGVSCVLSMCVNLADPFLSLLYTLAKTSDFP